VLLYGPPGTGKTLLARAVAVTLETNFLKVVSSAIVDKYIGESARVVREMFGYARDHEPCIIFMDEINLSLSLPSLSTAHRSPRLSPSSSHSSSLAGPGRTTMSRRFRADNSPILTQLTPSRLPPLYTDNVRPLPPFLSPHQI
jgi:DNA polymerase III delta prime subunit